MAVVTVMVVTMVVVVVLVAARGTLEVPDM